MKSIKQNLFYLPIVFFPLLLFSGAIFGGKALFWGTPVLQFIPWHSLAIESLRSGIVPLWNPYNGLGAPLAANYQSALFYPPNWLALIAGFLGGDSGLAWGHTALIMLHLVWMGLGMARLVSFLGYKPANQVIAALAFSLSGYFVARAGFFSMIWAGAWLPWVVRYASEISYPGQQPVQNQSVTINFRLVLCLGFQLLAGHAQLAWYTLLFTAAWVTAGAWQGNRWKGVLAGWRKLVPAGILAAALAAVQLLPTAQYLLLSSRSSTVDPETAMTYSLWPWRLLGFFLPDLFGNPGTGNYWGYASYWEDALYIGVLPMLLALMTLPNAIKRNANTTNASERRLTRHLWVFTLLSILLALGKNTPIFPFLFRYVPTFSMFNSPARFLIWAVFSLTLLAAIGFNYWRKPAGKGLYWLRLLTAGSLAITIGAFAAWMALQDVSITFIRATALCGLFLLISGVLTLTHPADHPAPGARYWQLALIVFIGCDLWIINQPNLPLVQASFYDVDRLAARVIPETGGRTYLPAGDEYEIKFGRFFTFDDFSEKESWDGIYQIGLPNANILTKEYSANNFDPIVTRRFKKLIDTLNQWPEQKRLALYNLMDVTQVIQDAPAGEYGISVTPIEGSRRFWTFPCAEFVENEADAWEAFMNRVRANSGGSMADTIVVESKHRAETVCHPAGDEKITVVEERPGWMALTVSSDQPGWLMVSESWYPGWKAAIDAQPAAVYAGNYLFQAIEYPAGTHTITLSYQPSILWIGILITCLAAAFIGVFSARRSKSSDRGN